MASKVSGFAVIIVTYVFFRTAVAPRPHDFTQLVLLWAPSYCNVIVDRNVCRMPLSPVFGIKSYRRMHYKDTPLDPYNPYDPCVQQVPATRESVTREMLESHDLLTLMDYYWAYLRVLEEGSHDQIDLSETSGIRGELNLRNWRTKWDIDGKCFDHPDRPNMYFSKGLYVYEENHGHGMLDHLIAANLIHKGEHPAYSFSLAIKNLVGALPQIRCNRDLSKNLQLYEISLCFDKKEKIMNCPEQYDECEVFDKIKFPPIPAQGETILA